jgi:2-polyprenyl-3-methyl-5-hydroxy-6-metoxy-1,4-benzoquinol methylase
MSIDCSDKNAIADELWEYYLGEYKSNNFIIKFLYNNYFSKLRKITETFERDFRLLEVGCGAGESSRRIFRMLNGQQHFEVSEFDERLVEKLKSEKFPYRVTRESVLSLQRKDNEFDVIFILEVLEHISDVQIALKEVFMVARCGVVISVPNEPLWRILNVLRGKYWRGTGEYPGPC